MSPRVARACIGGQWAHERPFLSCVTVVCWVSGEKRDGGMRRTTLRVLSAQLEFCFASHAQIGFSNPLYSSSALRRWYTLSIVSSVFKLVFATSS